MNREKVIEGLKQHRDGRFHSCDNCPYVNVTNCQFKLYSDALNLLKEQEAIKPYMDYDGQDVWRCGKCGNSLMHPSYYESDEDAKNYIRYCSHCGQAVKWNESIKEKT